MKLETQAEAILKHELGSQFLQQEPKNTEATTVVYL
jgi:hypothetical protein